MKLLLLFILSCSPLIADSPFEQTKDLPVAFQGRFRSLDSAARLWLYDTYHQQQLKKNDLASFHTTDPSAIDLLWNIHFFGHTKWNDSPFFWIHYATVKNSLGLDPKTDRFSFNRLSSAQSGISEKNLSDELSLLFKQLQLFISYEGSLNPLQKSFENFLTDAQQQGTPLKEISQQAEARFPFTQRLQTAGNTLKMLPAKFSKGEWVSLAAFNTKNYDPQTNSLVLSNNFTSFSNANFLALRKAYFDLESTVLSDAPQDQIKTAVSHFTEQYRIAYASLAGTAYKQAQGKSLFYPSESRLQAETLYYRIPLIEMTLCTYLLALILMFITRKRQKLGLFTLSIILAGFAIHTVVLILRCYILERPPVSNMFETVVYVPWIAVALGLIFYMTTHSRLILGAAIFASGALLVLLRLTQVDSRLENVQAVLDSQYWLIIHVLMIVASYGAFAVSGILGHFYLIDYAINKGESPSSEKMARGILHTMYVGVALLIPGTILGGVWAAESWGRFWDWDPKESWAFISACVYLLFIHAYTFRHIRDFGLAIGSVAGLLAISFTWYGVNYVLGTGLHSYGFGNGGESWYFLYVAIECLFLIFMLTMRNMAKNRLKKIG
jgi:ABC-type transport system involved in cytochrome c biogenesis permease subunit